MEDVKLERHIVEQMVEHKKHAMEQLLDDYSQDITATNTEDNENKEQHANGIMMDKTILVLLYYFIYTVIISFNNKTIPKEGPSQPV